MKTSPVAAKFTPMKRSLSIAEVQALQKHVKELEEMIEEISALGHNDRYRRLSRFELIMEIVDEYIDSGEEEEEEEEEES